MAAASTACASSSLPISSHKITCALIDLAAEKGLKNGTLLWPVRIALAGKQVTPGGAIEIALLLGREESLKRLKAGREKLA